MKCGTKRFPRVCKSVVEIIITAPVHSYRDMLNNAIRLIRFAAITNPPNVYLS